jgi:hypothetical protein
VDDLILDDEVRQGYETQSQEHGLPGRKSEVIARTP